jgi:hypothetical protein
MLGRIIACQRFVGFGTVPLGGLLGGGLATALGVRTALWILCAGYVLAGAVLLTSGIARRRDLPAAPAAPPAPPAAPAAPPAGPPPGLAGQPP